MKTFYQDERVKLYQADVLAWALAETAEQRIATQNDEHQTSLFGAMGLE